jgi:hypothetical protein
MNSSFHLLSNFLFANIQLESELQTTSLNKLLNTLNAELNPICYLLALLGAHHILHVSRIKVNNCVILQEKVAS